MSGSVARAGRPRPQGSGWELAVWYLMRLTGLALFVLALTHFLIVHLVVDPSVHNWTGLAMALRNQQISDFPLCNKSFDLSYCGNDL